MSAPGSAASRAVPRGGAAPAAAGAVAAFEVRGLTRRHGRGERAVLANDGIDLDVAAGEVFGLLGPNGAGKTTLVRQLVGLLRPDAGTVSLLGRDLAVDPRFAARAVAYLGQDEQGLEEVPVGVAVEGTARLRGVARREAHGVRDALLEELGLTAVAERPLRSLSGGQRRLAGVATALAGDRPVLVLDEPTTGLDPKARRAVWSALGRRREELGTTVLLVTHNVLEAETVLDRVAVLDRGRVIACETPGRLKAAVSDELRLELVWRDEPPRDPAGLDLAGLRARATVTGRRWALRLPAEEARMVLGRLTAGPLLAALDDFTLATPTLEDVYLLLGGAAADLERD